MRLIFSVGGVILLLGSMGWGQEAPGPFSRRGRHQPPQQQQQQNPADFAPDPPPTPVETPTTIRPAATPTPAAQPATSPPQITPPEQLPPATLPQVTYRDGLLTVVATNASLGALLSAIRNKAGIQFEGLENVAPERVAIAIGPAPGAEVLAAILGGSGFDYVVLERADSPGIVQRVVLSPKAGTTAVAGANAAQPAHNPDADADEEEASEEPITPQDTPVRPPLAQLPPQQPPQPQQPRTAEQMLEEMKRLQQQQQPQQNSPPNTAPIKPHQP